MRLNSVQNLSEIQ